MITLSHTTRFMLVGLVPPRQTKDKTLADFEELESLVTTLGGKVYALAIQSSNRRDNETFIGTGKAQEITNTLPAQKIDVVVLNAYAKPRQLYALKAIFSKSVPEIKVWDRIDLILHIFEKHAVTAEAKLQIKLAAIRHMGPTIYGIGRELSQQAGGIGTRGKGETSTERMHRHWKNEIRKVQLELKKMVRGRYQQMQNRKRDGVPTVSIVGYTNAGKTTLFNRLTGEHQATEDSLFVTLDSNVGKVYLPVLSREVYVTDTIGFIQDLPPQLVDAFQSTLMETVHADLLLHVIDTFDPRMEEKIAVVENILSTLKVEAKKQTYVFNKIDKAREIDQAALRQKYAAFSPQFISAQEGEGCKELISAISFLKPPLFNG